MGRRGWVVDTRFIFGRSRVPISACWLDILTPWLSLVMVPYDDLYYLPSSSFDAT